MTPSLDEIETLKAWCHWKRKESGASEDDLLMAKSIEDLVSQVGMFRAENAKLRVELAAACEGLTLIAAPSEFQCAVGEMNCQAAARATLERMGRGL